MVLSDVYKYIDEHKNAFTADLNSLIAIPSKRGPAEKDKPFGAECARALAKMEEIASSAGFKTINHENYMLECRCNEFETALGIIAHLDVVPEGDGWNTPPFILTEKDGIFFGRGVIDDKGPAMAAFYAFKALKAAGVKLSKNAVLLFGSDEESGMEDLNYYRKKASLPPMMISPDGEFPVINVEKGVCQVYFKKSYLPGGSLISLNAGQVVNAVPCAAKAVLKNVSASSIEKAISSSASLASFSVSSDDDKITLTAIGMSAHGSAPEKGNNALTALIDVLLRLDLPESELCGALNLLYSLFPYGECDGSHAGLEMHDKESGGLSALLSMFNAENGTMTGGIDIRFPATVKLDNVKTILEEKLQPLKAELSYHAMEGHIVPSDSAFIKTLLHCFTAITGLPGGCIAEGGATYLHNVPGGVAFGAQMPGEVTNMHGANECVKISTLINTAKIYATAIYELCK